MKKKNEGITLVALIITIIIMLILVGVSIQIVINSGLFETTKNAGIKTEEEYKNEANLGKKVTIDGEEYNSVDEYVAQSTCDHEWGEWIITKEVTCKETGLKNRICPKCGKIEEETIAKLTIHTIVDGSCTICGQEYSLEIGAYINGYDPSIAEDGSIINTSYTSLGTQNGYGMNYKYTVSSIVKWRIVGEENGQIMITTADSVQNVSGYSYLYFKGRTGYTNFDEELNKVSAIYGQGKYADTSKYSVNLGETTIASGGRSITLEDIGCTINATPTTMIYKKQQNPEDETDTTYYIYYGSTEDTLTKSNHTEFTYWGDDSVENPGTEWKTLGNDESVTIKNYGYTTGTRTTKQTEMIFNGSDGSIKFRYWLASSRNASALSFVNYSVRYVFNGNIKENFLCRSYGYDNQLYSYVRPVVYLKADIQLEYDSETGVYKIK